LKRELQRAFPFKKSSTADEFKKQGKPVKSESFQKFDDRGYCFIAFSLHIFPALEVIKVHRQQNGESAIPEIADRGEVPLELLDRVHHDVKFAQIPENYEGLERVKFCLVLDLISFPANFGAANALSIGGASSVIFRMNNEQ
jgi:hypothetical protein